MKTAQETFDTVATHLFTQGKPALEGGRCKYKTKEGLKCAVGCLVTDEKYDVEFENLGVDLNLLTVMAPEYSEHLRLLSALQLLHDSSMVQVGHEFSKKMFEIWKNTEEMKKALTTLAKEFKLDTAILDTLKFTDR